MKKAILFIFLMTVFVVSWERVQAQARVWQGTLALPTYGEGRPDPNPPFDLYATERFNYPYTLRNELSGAKSTQEWRAIFLENEYLKCSILPDIGGHIYTCTDKISGQPMFYANPSIKKARIGYRGAWAAFGVEFNFPVSHNWVSMSPVDSAYAAHSDGSASVWIGNIDRPYGMQWLVELVLRPGSTLLEEHVTLYNRSDVRHRYYWWNNAGVQVWDDSRIDYPMRWVASHGFTNVYNWPVNPSGKDLSQIKNQTGGTVSLFVHGSHEPFMGIWNPHTDAGIAHFAEYRELPAKKIWSWGVDPAGLGWRKALSDNDSAYVEVQAGLFRNQETYAFLDPGQSIAFTEYWMPVRETGGISRANQAGVVYFDHQGSNLSIALNVNRPITGARISLLRGNTILAGEAIDLTPTKTWKRTLASGGQPGAVTFELRDHTGQLLLRHTDGAYDWDSATQIQTGPQRGISLPEPEARTEDDWLQFGNGLELDGKSLRAFEAYKAGLKKYPHSQSLAIAAGRLAAALQRFEEAEPLLAAASARDTSNSEIGYYLGLVLEGLGRTREAEASLDIAYRQAAFRAPAAIRLGELHAVKDDLEAASMYLRDALQAEPSNLLAREELEAVLRARGAKEEAEQLVRQGLAIDPASDFLKVEAGVPDDAHLGADPYRVLRVAAQYMRLGLYRRALDLLDHKYAPVSAEQSEPGSVLPQQNPLVGYYSAYCSAILGMDASQKWKAASLLDSTYVFPSTTADRMVLEAAVKANAEDATAHALLGALLFSKGMSDEGIAQWRTAKRLAPDRKLLDVELANAALKIDGDLTRALASFREALRTDPENSAVYTGLDAAMSITGASATERAEALFQYPRASEPDSKMPADLVYQLALTLAEAGRFSQSLALFKDRFFPSEEGEITFQEVQFEVQRMQAEAQARVHDCSPARSFLESLNLGSVPGSASPRTFVRLAAIAQSCGMESQAQSWLRKAAAGGAPGELPWILRAEHSLGQATSPSDDKRLTDALSTARSMLAQASRAGSAQLTLGMLQAAANNVEGARASFRTVLLLSDTHMSHHLAREALAELSQNKAH